MARNKKITVKAVQDNKLEVKTEDGATYLADTVVVEEGQRFATKEELTAAVQRTLDNGKPQHEAVGVQSTLEPDEQTAAVVYAEIALAAAAVELKSKHKPDEVVTIPFYFPRR